MSYGPTDWRPPPAIDLPPNGGEVGLPIDTVATSLAVVGVAERDQVGRVVIPSVIVHVMDVVGLPILGSATDHAHTVVTVTDGLLEGHRPPRAVGGIAATPVMVTLTRDLHHDPRPVHGLGMLPPTF